MIAKPKIAVIFWGILLLTLPVIAQKPYLKQYTVEDGLLTNETYQVFQDNEGYIWIATSIGVNRFNGATFQTIEDKNDFRSQFINEVTLDGKGQIWFVTLSSKLYHKEKNGMIIPFAYNKMLSEKINTNKGSIKFSFKPISDSSVMISLKEKGAFLIERNGIVTSLYSSNSALVFDFTQLKPFISFNSKKGIGNYIDVITSKRTVKIPMEVYPTHMYACKISDDEFLASTDNLLYIIRYGKVQRYKLNDAITGLYKDRRGNIWVSINGHGVSRYCSSDFSKKPNFQILAGETVTSVLQDKEGSFWFSTSNSGIFFAPSQYVQNFTKEEGLVTNKLSKVFLHDGKVWLGYFDGFISTICSNGKVCCYKAKNQFNSYVKSINTINGDRTVYICADKLYRIKDGVTEDYEEKLVRPYFRDNKIYSLLPRAITPSKSGGFWLASNRGFKKIEKDKIIFDSNWSGLFSGIVYCITEDSEGGLYVASNTLYYFKDGKLSQIGKKYPSLDVSVINIVECPTDKRIWIATRGNGIIILDKGIVYKIGSEQGLMSNNISGMEIRGNHVWVSHNKGVECLTIKDWNKLIISIRHYNTTNGLISDDVRDLTIDDKNGYVYIATISGLSRIDTRNEGLNSLPPKVVVSSLKINEKDTITDRPLKLKYYQNFIDVSFDALTFKRMNGVVNYRYKLEGLSSKWYYTNDSRLNFYKLAPGDYNLYIQAQNNDGIWSHDSANVAFVIERPFWATLWFYILTIVLVGFIVFLIMRSRLKIARKISMYERKGNLWKNQSLSMQMNPHFIFNTLNSIQLFILRCDVDSSLYYLSKFSNLMRKTLENSNRIKVSLKEELEMLSIYLELEKLRSEDKFTYSIECDKSIIQTETYLPTMLIQPFVENAIWHGIMPKTDKGRVEIKISDSGAFVKCCVVDNGIGRLRSKEIKNGSTGKNYKSFATKIIGSRMELLKDLYNKEFGLKYIDLENPDGTPSGTEVVIIVPKDFYAVKQITLVDA